MVADTWHAALAAAGEPARVAPLLSAMLDGAPPAVRADVVDGRLRQRAVPDRTATPVDRLIAAGALTLLGALAAPRPATIGSCAACDCIDVYVDRSPRRNRAFCSTRCQSTTRVRRFRGTTADPGG